MFEVMNGKVTRITDFGHLQIEMVIQKIVILTFPQPTRETGTIAVSLVTSIETEKK
jgi:hypothetical protein